MAESKRNFDDDDSGEQNRWGHFQSDSVTDRDTDSQSTSIRVVLVILICNQSLENPF